MEKIIIVIISFLFISTGCNRPTKNDRQAAMPTEKKAEITQEVTARISADNPFENQPNAFCTVIRKLDVMQYAPGTSEEELNAAPHPPKYCLLDVCLDADETSIHILNLGDDTEPIMSAYKVICIFPSVDSAIAYAKKYQIIDVVIAD
ncbi:MAG: hypothetical protein ACK4IY_00495 [Chitinophagales bacterium]